MKPTLNIDDRVLEAAASIAGERNFSAGAVLSDRTRRESYPAGARPLKRKGFPVFNVSRDSTVLTLDRVKRYEEGP